MTLSLQQEDIVGIEVRPDAAAGNGVADHQIIEPGVGNEVEAGKQGVGLGQDMVERLDQQRPAGFRQASESALGERAVVELPVRAAALNQARLDIVAAVAVD